MEGKKQKLGNAGHKGVQIKNHLEHGAEGAPEWLIKRQNSLERRWPLGRPPGNSKFSKGDLIDYAFSILFSFIHSFIHSFV